jgi:hypothetical protein
LGLSKVHSTTSLGRGLRDALGRWRGPRAVHDPGKIIADLAVAVALGGDCLADLAVLRAQPELSGPVASDPVVSLWVPTISSTSRDQAIFVDRATGASLSSYAVLPENDRLW